MTIEEKLKEIIEMKYSNVKNFSEVIDLPYTTVRSILQRGILNAKVENVIKIAEGLNMKAEELMNINVMDSITLIYNQLNKPQQKEVYDFAKYQLEKQQRKSKTIVHLYGYVSAGTGEWADSRQSFEEVEVTGEVPRHDFAVKVNGDSMTPAFQNGEILYVKKATTVRDGQIIICRLNNELFVKKYMDGRLISLNKKYDPIPIRDFEDFEIQGIVVM